MSETPLDELRKESIAGEHVPSAKESYLASRLRVYEGFVGENEQKAMELSSSLYQAVNTAPHLANDFFATARLKNGEAIYLPVRLEGYPSEEYWLIEKKEESDESLPDEEASGIDENRYAKSDTEYEAEGYIVVHKVPYGWVKAGQKSQQGAISRVILRPISAEDGASQSVKDSADVERAPRRTHAFTDEGTEYEIMYLVFAGEPVKEDFKRNVGGVEFTREHHERRKALLGMIFQFFRTDPSVKKSRDKVLEFMEGRGLHGQEFLDMVGKDEQGNQILIEDMMELIYFDGSDPEITEPFANFLERNGITMEELYRMHTGFVTKHVDERVHYTFRGTQVIRMPQWVWENGEKGITMTRDRQLQGALVKMFKYTHFPQRPELITQLETWAQEPDDPSEWAENFQAQEQFYFLEDVLANAHGQILVITEGEIKAAVLNALFRNRNMNGKRVFVGAILGITMFSKEMARQVVKARPAQIRFCMDADSYPVRERADKNADSEHAVLHIAWMLEHAMKELDITDIDISVMRLADEIPSYQREIGDKDAVYEQQLEERVSSLSAQGASGELSEFKCLEELCALSGYVPPPKGADDVVMENLGGPKAGWEKLVRVFENARSIPAYRQELNVPAVMTDLLALRRMLRKSVRKDKIARERGLESDVSEEEFQGAKEMLKEFEELCNHFMWDCYRAPSLHALPADMPSIRRGRKIFDSERFAIKNLLTEKLVTLHTTLEHEPAEEDEDSERSLVELPGDIALDCVCAEDFDQEITGADEGGASRSLFSSAPIALHGVKSSAVKKLSALSFDLHNNIQKITNDKEICALIPKLARGYRIVTGKSEQDIQEDYEMFLKETPEWKFYAYLACAQIEQGYRVKDDFSFQILEFIENKEGKTVKIPPVLAITKQGVHGTILRRIIVLEGNGSASIAAITRLFRPAVSGDESGENEDGRMHGWGSAEVGSELLNWWKAPVLQRAHMQSVENLLKERMQAGALWGNIEILSRAYGSCGNEAVEQASVILWEGLLYFFHELELRMKDITKVDEVAFDNEFSENFGSHLNRALEIISKMPDGERGAFADCKDEVCAWYENIKNVLKPILTVQESTKPSKKRKQVETVMGEAKKTLSDIFKEMPYSNRLPLWLKRDELALLLLYGENAFRTILKLPTEGVKTYLSDTLLRIKSTEQKFAEDEINKRSSRLNDMLNSARWQGITGDTASRYLMVVTSSDLDRLRSTLHDRRILTDAMREGWYEANFATGTAGAPAPVFQEGALMLAVLGADREVTEMRFVPRALEGNEMPSTPVSLDGREVTQRRLFLADRLSDAQGSTLIVWPSELSALQNFNAGPCVGLNGARYDISDNLVRRLLEFSPKDIVIALPKGDEGENRRADAEALKERIARVAAEMSEEGGAGGEVVVVVKTHEDVS